MESDPHNQYYTSMATTLEQTRIFTSVCLGVLVWDWLVTLHLEFRYFWNAGFRRITLLDCLFFLNRYGELVTMSVSTWLSFFPKGSLEDCKRIFLFQAYAPIPVLACCAGMMSIRIYGVYGQSKLIAACLGLLLAAQIVVQSFVPAHAKPLVLPEGLRACVPGEGIELYWLYWLVVTVFDTVIVCLSLYKSMKLWRAGGKSIINAVLIRDGLAFYLICMGANLANMVYYAATGPRGNRLLLAPLPSIISSISCSRLVFNLKSTSRGERPVFVPHSTESFRARVSKKSGAETLELGVKSPAQEVHLEILEQRGHPGEKDANKPYLQENGSTSRSEVGFAQ